MSQVVSYAEESCWNGEELRLIRQEVVFQVQGYVGGLLRDISLEFRADYGLWYDYEDTVLLEILGKEKPEVDWGWFVFFKLPDHSRILIVDPTNDRTVGSIHTRRGAKRKLSGENIGGNVIILAAERERRAKREDPTESQ